MLRWGIVVNARPLHPRLRVALVDDMAKRFGVGGARAMVDCQTLTNELDPSGTKPGSEADRLNFEIVRCC